MTDNSVGSKKFELRRQLIETLNNHERMLALLPANHKLIHKIHEIVTIISHDIAVAGSSLSHTKRRETKPKPIEISRSPSQISTSSPVPMPRSSLATSLEGSLFLTPSPKQKESQAAELSYPEIAVRHPPAPQVKLLGNKEGICLEQACLNKKREAPQQPPSDLPRSIFKKRKA